MFEKPEARRSVSLWKLTLGSLIVLAILAAATVYFTGSGEPEELTGVLRPGHPEFERYREKLTLDRPRASLATGFSGNRTVLCYGTLNNHGDRTLDVVEIKVTLFNYEQPILEIIRTPVRPGAYSTPIPPLQKRSFTLMVEKVPKEWKSSHAEFEISGFRFRSSED